MCPLVNFFSISFWKRLKYVEFELLTSFYFHTSVSNKVTNLEMKASPMDHNFKINKTTPCEMTLIAKNRLPEFKLFEAFPDIHVQWQPLILNPETYQEQEIPQSIPKCNGNSNVSTAVVTTQSYTIFNDRNNLNW